MMRKCSHKGGQNEPKLLQNEGCKKYGKNVSKKFLFLDPPDPAGRGSRVGGSTIFTKSPFSKKHRKSRLRRLVFGPKSAKNRRRATQNRQLWRKKSILAPSVFLPFFRSPKKPDKVRKKAIPLMPPVRIDGLRGPGGEVRRGKLSGYGGNPGSV